MKKERGRRNKRVFVLPEPRRTTLQLLEEIKRHENLLGVKLDTNLDAREKRIFEARYGFPGLEELLSPKQVASRENSTVDEVEKITARVIGKLAATARRKMDEEEKSKPKHNGFPTIRPR